MITAQLQGGIGNCLFQIAAAVAQAKRMGTSYSFHNFPYSKHFAGDFKISTTVVGGSGFREETFHYTPLPKSNDLSLFGYFQSEKYWQGYEKEIRDMFKPKIKHLYESYEPLNKVSIHVRRCDYLELSDYHYNQEVNYYKECINYFIKKDPNVEFIVFSDDPHWCRTTFPDFIVNDGGMINDFFTMAKCRHHIIANSSFSWWASYLYPREDKIIIAPKNWFGVKKAHLDTSDLYRDEFTVI